jgi:hypothetical protein
VLPKSGQFQGRLVAIVSVVDCKAKSVRPEPTLVTGREKSIADAVVSTVRDSLSARIPAYMIPSTWMVVEEIPQLPSGKLNRRKISDWLLDMDEKSLQLINPTFTKTSEATTLTSSELKLQKIVCQVLNLHEDQVPFGRSFLGLGVGLETHN